MHFASQFHSRLWRFGCVGACNIGALILESGSFKGVYKGYYKGSIKGTALIIGKGFWGP